MYPLRLPQAVVLSALREKHIITRCTMRNKKTRKRGSDGIGFWADMKRDWNTLKQLRGKALLVHLWEYYKWFFLTVICVIWAAAVFANILWEGQKPCRLRVCVVLNTEDNCQRWFDDFGAALTADGKPGALDVNLDQPFDYDNMYYYVQEAEVMTTISSGRMDVAICGEDMYSYLLALNACLPLDEALPEEMADALSGQMVYSTANLTVGEDGQVDPADGIDGYYALDLTQTEFAAQYNQGEGSGPLYGVVISNTEHLEDSFALLRALFGL